MVFEVTLKQYFCYVIDFEGHIPGSINCNSIECQNIGKNCFNYGNTTKQ